MAYIKIPKGWEIPENQVTPESDYINRRKFIKDLGLASAGTLLFSTSNACAQNSALEKQLAPFRAQTLAAEKNANFTVERQMTDEVIAATYNNYYEFTQSKSTVWKRVERFKTRPWEIEISGLVEKPMTLDVDDLIKMMPLEERIYRFRCVETWAMVVPWIGFPMKALLERVQPKADAKYVSMLTFFDPDVAPHQHDARLPWPYLEGLTLAEAMNDLTLLVVGIYGHILPPQHGAPIRLIVPWKYGFKSIKSIVSIELTDKKPRNFWNIILPREYDFEANVNPNVPHPRWSQATEWMIGSRERHPTLIYNGYGDAVAHLYER
ncbi:protein-methionine-sulfoxide reductase catalytic subunit MsrP [Candidatus Poribacteria bacterium]|nr:protein-methionine-sulfoxide reductase catalytic subunit MsrP [Candidatus Poribacteria bacterium]MYK93020.1 protein-methionine-sulfoxide reductase catalytic subunit MsrP [Candidatus Poribacteria bacterium]